MQLRCLGVPMPGPLLCSMSCGGWLQAGVAKPMTHRGQHRLGAASATSLDRLRFACSSALSRRCPVDLFVWVSGMAATSSAREIGA